jgi:hypothetical protein
VNNPPPSAGRGNTSTLDTHILRNRWTTRRLPPGEARGRPRRRTSRNVVVRIGRRKITPDMIRFDGGSTDAF